MDPVIVIATITARPEAVDIVRAELEKLVEPTCAKDAGCLRYELHQDANDPATFVFVESWESEELLRKHLATEHLEAQRRATEGLIESRDIRILTRIA